MLENIEGIDLDCFTFTQYKSILDDKIQLNKCISEINTLLRNKHINKNNVVYEDAQVTTLFGFWYNFCEKDKI